MTTTMMRVPKAASDQEVRTPRIFLDAVEKRFGKVTLDLAANAENAVCRSHFGPGSSLGEDALAQRWDNFGLQWLNPPFRNVRAWAEKCYEESALGSLIAMLAPASVCTDWFIEYVKPHAYVFELTPRVFKVEVRDCILALYTPEGYVGRETWRWR